MLKKFYSTNLCLGAAPVAGDFLRSLVGVRVSWEVVPEAVVEAATAEEAAEAAEEAAELEVASWSVIMIIGDGTRGGGPLGLAGSLSG